MSSIACFAYRYKKGVTDYDQGTITTIKRSYEGGRD